MRRMASAVVLACCAMATALFVPAGSSGEPATNSTVSVLFSTKTQEESATGSVLSTLEARGRVVGPGNQNGGSPLLPALDHRGSLPRVTYVKHRLRGDRTYHFAVVTAQYLKGPHTTVLILSLELTASDDPNCRARHGATSGLRGKLVLNKRSAGNHLVTLDLPCGIDSEWAGEDEVNNIGFEAVVRTSPPKTTPTPSTSGAATFTLTSPVKVFNPNAPELTIDTAGGKAVWDHTGQYGGAGKGGEWKVTYTFKVPKSLTTGQSASITLSLKAESVEPSQPLSVQMSARAPDFVKALSINYPSPADASQTFTFPISAGYKDFKDMVIVISVVSAEVTYTYHRVGA